MKIAIYQMDIIPGNRQANWDKVEMWTKQVVSEHQPAILVLPEMWTTAYTLPTLATCADTEKGETIEFLKSLAQTHGVHIIGGSIASMENGEIYNRAVVVNREGEVVYVYDKIHLVPMLNEHLYLSGGQSSGDVFELDGIKMGVIICYDLRFPELARYLAVEGAKLLFLVAEWPEARERHWSVLQQARAIENQLYVISANRCGLYDDVEFCGRSQVITPWGEVVKEANPSKEETIVVEMDVSEVEKVRESVPIFSSRVPTLYKYK